MGLFDKKYCDICGEKIKFLGTRKLEDGNLCKDCAKKLSPWFSDRKRSTVAEIREQLEYRKANEKEVETFSVTHTIGDRAMILIDKNHGKFLVTTSRNWREENPDVLDFSSVTGCDLQVDEEQTELKRKNTEGKEVSYNPPCYEYRYNFEMLIYINHPYFSEMRFRLNRNEVIFQPHPQRGMINTPINANPRMLPEYQRYEQMGNEIRQLLLTGQQNFGNIKEPKAEAPQTQITCPWCGSLTYPDENGCCSFCKGSLNG